MTQIGKVSLRGLYVEDKIYTFQLETGITAADVGKAVTLDTSGANKVKLAGNQEEIIGRLESVEVRTQEGITVGAVALDGSFEFLIDTDATASSPDQTPSVGEYITGAALSGGAKGYVQKSLNNAVTRWRVVEILTDGNVVAIKI